MGVARYLDKAYMLIVGLQLLGMLINDLVEFYPKALWEAPSAPLHFLIPLKQSYAVSSGDPFFLETTHEPWFQSMMYIELFAQLPLCLYLVYKLASKKNTDAATELAGIAFACLTGMGSVVCCYHLAQLGEEALDPTKRASLLYGTYLPFAVIPILMGIDMHCRVLTRIRDLEKKVKSQ